MNCFRIDKINKTVNFTFPYNEDIIYKIKSSDYNHRWNPELKEWIIPVNDWSKGKIMNIIKQFNFVQVYSKEEEVNIRYERTEVNYAYLRGLVDSKDFAYQARDYQLEALGYALDKHNIINGDDVGLGKTFESILYAEVTNSFPCLVIVPASVKYNWLEKWLEITKSKASICAIESGSKNNDWSKDIVVINYDIIGKKQGTGATVKFEELIKIPWKMVIFDEAHFLKNTTSQRSKAAKKIVNKIKKTGGKVQLLTGTATMNKPIELWNLLDFVGAKEAIADNWEQFVYRYCGGYKGKFGWVTSGATNTFELNRKMRNNCYIRREKRDVLTELPDVTKQIINVNIDNKKRYQAALDDLIQFIREEKGEEAAEKAGEAEHLVALGLMRKLTIEGKLKAIEQYLKDWSESGEKLLVFGLHREPLDYLSKKFKSELIAGGVSAKKKQEMVKRFVENDDIFLFGNMESAGTGVDGLQNACSNMLIIELPWRPSDLTQAIGRLDRSGQKNATTVTFMLSQETIDKEMWEMLEEKEMVTEAVNKGIDISKTDGGMKAVLKKLLKNNKK